MTNNEALEIVKAAIAKNPSFGVLVTCAWNRVCDSIEARALAAKVKPKVFEVHHETQVSRAALFVNLATGGTIETAEQAARESIGL